MHYPHSYRLESMVRGEYSDDGGEDMPVKLSFTLQAKFCEVSSRGVSDDGRVGLYTHTHTHTQARGTSNAV